MGSVVTRNRRRRRPHSSRGARGDSPTSTPTPPICRRSCRGCLVVNAARAALRARHHPRPLRSGPPANLHAGVLVTSGRPQDSPTLPAARPSPMRPPRFIDDPDTITAVQVHRHPRRDHRSRPHIPTPPPPRSKRSAGFVPCHGIGGRTHAEPEFLPTPITRIFLSHSIDYQTCPVEVQQRDPRTTRRRTAAAGPAAKNAPGLFRLDTPGDRRTGQLSNAVMTGGHRRQRMALPAGGRGLRPDRDPPHSHSGGVPPAYPNRPGADRGDRCGSTARRCRAPGSPAAHRSPDRLRQPAGRAAPTLEPVTRSARFKRGP